jgi:putative transposase
LCWPGGSPLRNAVPPIHEEIAALKERRQHEHDGHKKPRLPMLYLLATRQARDRQEVARLLGVHRNTISRWLARYTTGGLEAVLAIDVPTGKPVSLAPHVLASLEQALHRPEGFASYAELRQWLRRTHGVEVQDKTLYTIVRTRFQLKLKVTRPTHTKTPEAMLTFQAACHDHLQRAIPPDDLRPLLVFRQDESRFGLLTVRRRRLTARGVQPLGPGPHVFAWCYVDGAVEPTTGDRFFLELPDLNAEMLQLFIDAFAAAFPCSLKLLLLDTSGAHTAARLILPANVRLVFLPPSGPELNPIERLWRDLKDAVAWLQFPTLEVQQASIADLLQAYQAATLQSLTTQR